MKTMNKILAILICLGLSGCQYYSQDFDCPGMGPGVCDSISNIYFQTNEKHFKKGSEKNIFEYPAEPLMEFEIDTTPEQE